MTRDHPRSHEITRDHTRSAEITRLRPRLRVGASVSEGEITNLMGSDAQRIADLTPYLHALWFAPLQATAAMALELRTTPAVNGVSSKGPAARDR